MSEIDQKIVTAKARVDRLTAELISATAYLVTLGMEKQKLLENAPIEEVVP